MIYPLEILPNNKRKLISCDIHDYFLTRYTPTSIITDLIDEETGDVKQTSICSPKEHISDLSTSLLGVFKLAHNKIVLTKESSEKLGAYCDPDCNAEVPVFGIDFYIDENKGFWTIHIEKIINEPVTYFFGKNPEVIYTATCCIVHTPTFWNYWHFSIKWYLNEHGCYLDEYQDNNMKEKIKKRLSGVARAMIAKFAKIIEPDFQEMPLNCYSK